MARVVGILSAAAIVATAIWLARSDRRPSAVCTSRTPSPAEAGARGPDRSGGTGASEMKASPPPTLDEIRALVKECCEFRVPEDAPAREWDVVDRLARFRERLSARKDRQDRIAVVAEFTRLLLSEAPRPIREEAAGLLGELASSAELAPVGAAAAEGAPTTRALAVGVLVAVFDRSREGSILDLFRSLARTDLGRVEFEEAESIYGRAIEILAREGDASAAEAWVRYREAALPLPCETDRLHSHLAAHLEPALVERVETLISRERLPDCDLAMVLDAAGRSEWKRAAQEARRPLLDHPDAETRTRAAGELLRLRDVEIVPRLLVSLQTGLPVPPEHAHELLREHTGASISALDFRVGVEVRDEAERRRRVADRWEAWWTKESVAFLSRHPFASK